MFVITSNKTPEIVYFETFVNTDINHFPKDIYTQKDSNRISIYIPVILEIKVLVVEGMFGAHIKMKSFKIMADIALSPDDIVLKKGIFCWKKNPKLD